VKRSRTPLFETNSRSIFDKLDSWSGLVGRLADIRLEDNEVIQLATVGSGQNLAELFMSDRAPRGVVLKTSRNDLHLFRFTRKVGKKFPETVSGKFLVAESGNENIYFVVFVAAPRVWRLGIQPLIESLYPRAARPFLTQTELKTLVDNIGLTLQPSGRNIKILEVSSKKRLPRTARKRFESLREWTDTDVQDVFEVAREQHTWFRSISFDVVSQEDNRIRSTGIRGRLSKHGYFYCNGEFELFEKTLVCRLSQFSSERVKFFSERDRVSTPDHSPRPLRIKYQADIFKSKKQTQRLVESMRRFKHGTCTVLHANPYVHLSVVDNIDYSSAEVWVLSLDEILVVPQVRASEPALERIVSHLFEYFREGSISEYESGR
jgi:hypothetical protein